MNTTTGDVLRIAAKFRMAGSADVINVFHVKVASVASPPLADSDVSDGVGAWLGTAYGYLKASQCDDMTATGAEIFNVTQNYRLPDATIVGYTAGSKTAHPLAWQNALVCNFPTNEPGHVGRKFLGGFSEDGTDDGKTITSATVTALGNFASIILGGISTLLFTADSGLYDYGATTWREFVAAVVRNAIYTQRRRRVGVGS